MILLTTYALSFVGLPYIYGGNNPVVGLDCSGLVCEILKSVGAIGGKEDLSAQQLFDRFQHSGRWNSYGAGSLVFFGKSVTDISHVAVMIDRFRIVEAGSGDPTVLTVDDAIKKNAFVRVREITNRKDLVAVIRPPYPMVGVP